MRAVMVEEPPLRAALTTPWGSAFQSQPAKS